VQKVHAGVANARKNLIHETTSMLAKNYDVIVIAVSYTHLDVYKRQVQGVPHHLARALPEPEEGLSGNYAST